MPDSVFVYGTLKQNEERSHLWPRSPLRIESATVDGRLYDLGPYPALIRGENLVRGELWHFSAADIAVTLSTLDQIEGYAARADDLYVRRVVDCHMATGHTVQAYAYFYVRSDQLHAAQLVPLDTEGMQSWHGGL